MKSLLVLLLLAGSASTLRAQAVASPTQAAVSATPAQVVEASCGQCRLGLPGKGCDLAVRIEGKAYFVDGTNIDSHGDAHAKDGFCQAIRKAEVQGQVVNNRFVATSFRLLPETKTAQ